MTPFWGFDREVARWVAKQLEKTMPDMENGFGNCRAMGVMDDAGELVAGMVYHNWQRTSGVIEISGAGVTPRWLSPKVLREMFDYPFERAGVQLVVMRVSSDDKRLGRILGAYGFKGYLIPRLRGKDRDEVIYTLSDDDWRANKFKRRDDGQTQGTYTT